MKEERRGIQMCHSSHKSLEAEKRRRKKRQKKGRKKNKKKKDRKT